MKKAAKKKVLRHLKGDIKTFKKEAVEDKELMKSIKGSMKKEKPKKKEKKHNPKTKYAKNKIEKVMHEFKEGDLHSGSKKGPKVKSRKQAVAIALSEARKKKRK